MLFEYSSLGAEEPAGTKLIIFTPLDEEDSVQKLERLLRGEVARS